MTPAHHFAKLFADVEGRQILVVHETCNDQGRPEVRTYYRPANELGVCTFAQVYASDDRGHTAARALFERVDETAARLFAAGIRGEVDGLNNSTHNPDAEA